jgi:hypothetical protein
LPVIRCAIDFKKPHFTKKPPFSSIGYFISIAALGFVHHRSARRFTARCAHYTSNPIRQSRVPARWR